MGGGENGGAVTKARHCGDWGIGKEVMERELGRDTIYRVIEE